jgi:hypothetical protein
LRNKEQEKRLTLNEHDDDDDDDRSIPYRAVNTLRLGNTNQPVNVYREIIAVCSQIHTKHINTQCKQNVELLNVKLVVDIVTTAL